MLSKRDGPGWLSVLGALSWKSEEEVLCSAVYTRLNQTVFRLLLFCFDLFPLIVSHSVWGSFNPLLPCSDTRSFFSFFLLLRRSCNVRHIGDDDDDDDLVVVSFHN